MLGGTKKNPNEEEKKSAGPGKRKEGKKMLNELHQDSVILGGNSRPRRLAFDPP